MDESVAIAFDLECNEVLTRWEIERDRQKTDSAVAEAFAGTKIVVERDKPKVLNA